MRKLLKYTALVLTIGGCLWCSARAALLLYDHGSGMSAYERLRQQVQHAGADGFDAGTKSSGIGADFGDTSGTSGTSDSWLSEDTATSAQVELIARYALPGIDEDALRSINPDYAAWVYIPDTKVDYPAVLPPDNSAYLTKTFDGQKRACGSLFLDAYEAPFGANTILYGHNMKAGDMFGGLKKFRAQDYADAHPDLFLYRNGLWRHYRLYAVYPVEYDAELPYRTDFTGREDYAAYLERIAAASEITAPGEENEQDHDERSGPTALADRKLLTLSTCQGSAARLIVQWLACKEGQ